MRGSDHDRTCSRALHTVSHPVRCSCIGAVHDGQGPQRCAPRLPHPRSASHPVQHVGLGGPGQHNRARSPLSTWSYDRTTGAKRRPRAARMRSVKVNAGRAGSRAWSSWSSWDQPGCALCALMRRTGLGPTYVRLVPCVPSTDLPP